MPISASSSSIRSRSEEISWLRSTSSPCSRSDAFIRSECSPERADIAAREGGRQQARAAGGVVALLQQRVHALSEFGQLRGRAFAPEQVAAEFGLELLDRPCQRRLRDVALVGGAREIQRPRDGEEVTYLVHFHDPAAPIFPAGSLADR